MVIYCSHEYSGSCLLGNFDAELQRRLFSHSNCAIIENLGGSVVRFLSEKSTDKHGKQTRLKPAAMTKIPRQ